jgi:hypothetical protein
VGKVCLMKAVCVWWDRPHAHSEGKAQHLHVPPPPAAWAGPPQLAPTNPLLPPSCLRRHQAALCHPQVLCYCALRQLHPCCKLATSPAAHPRSLLDWVCAPTTPGPPHLLL